MNEELREGMREEGMKERTGRWNEGKTRRWNEGKQKKGRGNQREGMI